MTRRPPKQSTLQFLPVQKEDNGVPSGWYPEEMVFGCGEDCQDDGVPSGWRPEEMVFGSDGPPSKMARTSAGPAPRPAAKRKGKPREKFIHDMHRRFHGKKREDVLGKASRGDESVIHVELEPAEKKSPASRKCRSRCVLCDVVMNNDVDTIMVHLRSRAHQQAEQCLGERGAMGAHLKFGGASHRESVVDSMMLAYFVMREKQSHTLPAKMKMVMRNMHCVDRAKLDKASLSATTIAR